MLGLLRCWAIVLWPNDYHTNITPPPNIRDREYWIKLMRGSAVSILALEESWNLRPNVCRAQILSRVILSHLIHLLLPTLFKTLKRVLISSWSFLYCQHTPKIKRFSWVYSESSVVLSDERRRFDLVETRLTEASNFVCFDSAHPKYWETICVHSDVAQIWVVVNTQRRIP